jgi:hypothetical protein
MKENEETTSDKGIDEKKVEEIVNRMVNEGLKCESPKRNSNRANNATGGAIYGLGFIGAAIYFISTATGFWMGVVGFLKAIVWPAILIYEVLNKLGI